MEGTLRLDTQMREAEREVGVGRLGEGVSNIHKVAGGDIMLSDREGYLVKLSCSSSS